jgi:hypothetical protein
LLPARELVAVVAAALIETREEAEDFSKRPASATLRFAAVAMRFSSTVSVGNG